MPSEDQSLFIRDILWSLLQCLIKDLGVIFPIHFRHQLLNLLILHFKLLIAEDPHSALIALSDETKLICLP